MSEEQPQRERYEVIVKGVRWICLFAICLLTILTGLAAAVCILWPEPAGSRLNPRIFCRVRVGMTPQQVEDAYGVPPGDYSSRPSQVRHQALARRQSNLRREDWVGEGNGASVYFGPDGKVADWKTWGNNPPKPNWRDRLNEWLYFLKHSVHDLGDTRGQPFP